MPRPYEEIPPFLSAALQRSEKFQKMWIEIPLHEEEGVQPSVARG
jgi:hypothetical protein